jgi:hypothetical protein
LKKGNKITMTNSLSESSYQELLLWLLRRRKGFKVVGNSMLPLLQPGEEILIDLNAYREIVPQVGDIVVTTPVSYTHLTLPTTYC